MALWLVRAGQHGEREDVALERNVVVIGWEELRDLSGVAKREDLAMLLRQSYPNAKPKRLTNWESQIWPFVRVIELGDLVALPLKSRPVIAFARVTGKYEYHADFPRGAEHTRKVEWIGEYPRSQFDQDLLYSFGAFMTVCRIRRNNAEQRVQAILSGRPRTIEAVESPDEVESNDLHAEPDLEGIARGKIRDYIAQNYSGHRLAGLVAEVLQTQGYQVRVSPEGPDGGVDIIAGRGPLGFDPPRLAVQVKSGEGPVDVKVLRELQGVMKSFGADHGLVVAWGGYRGTVMKEAARSHFEIRLWNDDDLIRMIQAQYHELPDSIQAELPLKRIWTLIQSEE
jgi:restriction system protein